MATDPKRRGRPPKETALTAAEHAKHYRARQKTAKQTAIAARVAAIENNPHYRVAQLQAALDAAHEKYREQQAKIAEQEQTIATLNLRLVDAEFRRDRITQEVHSLRSRFDYWEIETDFGGE